LPADQGVFINDRKWKWNDEEAGHQNPFDNIKFLFQATAATGGINTNG